MQFTRRDILKKGAVATALCTLPSTAQAVIGHSIPEPLLIDANDPKVKSICAAAISAAEEAGAAYADIKMSHMYNRKIGGIPPEIEIMSAGVRVLVDGYWGFASSPIWSTDEGARLGRAAVRQAKANNIDGPREIEIAPLQNVQSGEWIMPVKTDPFELNVNEITDYLGSLMVVMQRWPGVSPQPPSADFRRLDKYFASTLNQKLFQRTYLTSANVSFQYRNKEGRMAGVSLDSLTPAGKGFEYIKEGNIREELRKLYEEVKEDLMFPYEPVDVGRFSILLERSTLADLLHKTLGPATELDRILGYEANSSGTSFINDPAEMVGTLKVASPEVTIISERSAEGGAGTVKWDDEGVEPRDLTLIDKGILKEVQTDRERAGWLSKNLGDKFPAAQSSGNLVSDIAQVPPNIFSGNLTIVPGEDTLTEKSMLEEMEDGIFIKRGSANVDFQLSSGVISGWAFAVKKGKRTAMLSSAGVLFRTSELWNMATRVGGKSSQRTYGHSGSKTNYFAGTTTSVTGSPVLFKEGTVIDVTRKA